MDDIAGEIPYMKISVVVPVFNAQHTILRCLDSLVSQASPPFEIIVVDNGSTDASPQLIRDFINRNPSATITYTIEAKTGPSWARNRGIKVATGDIVAFTDADCVADRLWTRHLAEAFQDTGIAAVAGNITAHQPENLIQTFLALFTLRGLGKDEDFREFSLVRGGFPTANLSIRKEVLDTISGFEPLMEMYTEDYDLCARIYSQGHVIRYVDRVVVQHIHRTNIRGLIRQSYGFGWGHAHLLKKYFDRFILVQLPFLDIQSTKFRARIWLNLAAADKKLIGICITGLIYSPLWLLIPLYLAYLSADIYRRATREGYRMPPLDSLGAAALLIMKSLSMSAGSLCGSIRYRTMCL